MTHRTTWYLALASLICVGVLAEEAHWAFVPPTMPAIPAVKDAAWCQTPIDRFVRAAQEAKGLKPLQPASRAALIRRLSFDLTGLPPTPAETQAFEHDTRPDAYERVVERLLASERYGERWGRFWLDVARYADSNGQDENYAIANAWRYRDWVIAAMNEDLPFDEFVRWQIAGDLLGDEAKGEAERLQQLTATGYLVLGPKMLAEQDKEKLLLDVADEQLDTISRGLLGMSFSCARCHDHKTDPVSQREYSALAGILRSTQSMEHLNHVSRWNELQVASEAELAAIAKHKEDTAETKKALSAAVEAANEELLNHRRTEVARYLVSAGELLAANDGSGLQPQAISAMADREGLSPASLKEWLKRLNGSVGMPQFAETAKAEAWLAKLGEDKSLLTTRRPGRVGAALHCRDRQVVDVAHAPELEPEKLTVEAWIRMEVYPGGDTGSRRWIVNKNDDEWAKGHYALVINESAVGAYLNPEGGREKTLSVWSKQELLKLNRWHHLAMSYDGKRVLVYLDGKKVAEKGGGRPLQSGGQGLRIGGRQDDFVYFDGGIDEVAIYDRILSGKELALRAKEPESQLPPGLIRRWQFEPTSEAEHLALVGGRLHEVLFGKNGAVALPKKAREEWTTAARENVEELEAARDKLAKNKPPAVAMAPGVAEGKPKSLPVFRRGDHTQPMDDELVPRGFPAALSTPETLRAQVVPETASGRREMANWLTATDNPLTARVFANRVWQAYFGDGLVRSPQNFGTTGLKPAMPDLLDYLAVEFMNRKWSIKELHRQIVFSSVYQTQAAAGLPKDPENLYLTHVPRRRLEAEMVRDAVLAVAGDLDVMSGGSLLSYNNKKYVPRTTFPRESRRRSVYLPVIRDSGYDVFETFDVANAAVCTSQRQSSVVAQQALFFLNSELVRRNARNFAKSVMAMDGDNASRLGHAWQRAYGRQASAAELAPLLAYLAKPPTAAVAGEDNPQLSAWTDVCQVLFAANEFIYLD